MAFRCSRSPNISSLSFFLAIFLFPTIFSPSAASLSFNFPSFDSNHPEIYTENDTSVSSVGIDLTRIQRDLGPGGSVGRATYIKPLHLWDKASGTLSNFSTNFSFIINSGGDYNYGDGLAFFLSPNGSRVPLDLYNDHIGINVRSMKSVNTVPWQSSVMEGNITDVSISYDSRNKILDVMYTYIHGDSIMQDTISAEVDMAMHLPEWVTFGFSASTGRSDEINRVISWGFSSSVIEQVGTPPSQPVGAPPNNQSADPNPVLPKESRNSKTGMLVGFAVAGCALIIVTVGVALYCSWKKRGKEEEARTIDPVFDVSLGDDFKSETGPRNFSYKELANATNNFSEAEMLGKGGFGPVHRGFLKELNSYVAVKRVSRQSKQGIKEYAAEVKIISRMRHRNLVKLIGWCHEKELLLAYEFMPNGSLDSHLFKGKSLLTWELELL
ncbi:hypothetical protein GH714_040548 [Hevea brasiliensis]|uniref:Protein kinase domain-containing protein n=1 Tax=Hevea brasiliensis TaxID=3981 RepID=A0A6A6L547_HEVBR|nr:hypothetical protein GH714_040548 [Hevea brasiliensis]